MEFRDNCGTWDTKSTSTQTTFFVRQKGKLVSIMKKLDKNCNEIKKKFVSLQPDESDVFILKQYNATLKRAKTYKKRISWFENTPGFPIESTLYVLAEYVGKFSVDDISKHGNARKTHQ